MPFKQYFKSRPILFSLGLIFIIGFALWFAFILAIGFMKGRYESSLYSVSPEYCAKFSESDLMGTYQGGESRMKLQMCYEDYFFPKNCNWIELQQKVSNQLPLTPLDDSAKQKKDLVSVAKKLEQKGLKLCEVSYFRTLYGVPPKYEFPFWQDSPLIENKYLSDALHTITDEYLNNQYPMQAYLDTRPSKIPNGIYTTYGTGVKKINRTNGTVTSYETDNSKTNLLTVQSNDAKLTVLKVYEIPNAKDANGPFHFQLSSTKWLIFNGDLTTCKTVELKKENEEYNFYSQECKFDEKGQLVLSAK